MKVLIALRNGVILSSVSAALAQAQPAPPLSYVQPVPPAAVQSVQERLHNAGAYNGAADGVWGPDSQAALQRFQASHQLQVTGQLNQATAATLGLDPAALQGTPVTPPAPPPPERLQANSVRSIQAELRRLGFYNGNVDGVWGQSTQTSIEQFQQNRGLQPNGQLNDSTVAAMGLPPNSLAYR